MPFVSPFFTVSKGGDCCGSRIIDHWRCNDQKIYKRDSIGRLVIDPKSGLYVYSGVEVFSKERIVSDLKATFESSKNPCFWWVQITASQNKLLQDALLEAGFEKVAVGLNNNTNHIIHAYFYNARYRVDETSWQTRTRAEKPKGKEADGSNTCS